LVAVVCLLGFLFTFLSRSNDVKTTLNGGDATAFCGSVTSPHKEGDIYVRASPDRAAQQGQVYRGQGYGPDAATAGQIGANAQADFNHPQSEAAAECDNAIGDRTKNINNAMTAWGLGFVAAIGSPFAFAYWRHHN